MAEGSRIEIARSEVGFVLRSDPDAARELHRLLGEQGASSTVGVRATGGALYALLTVALGSGGALTALVQVLHHYLDLRRETTVEVRSEDGTQVVTRGVKVEQVTALLQDLRDAREPGGDRTPQPGPSTDSAQAQGPDAPSVTVPYDLSALTARVRDLAAGRSRVLLGIAGVPGAGKSTLAEQLAESLAPDAVVVPFDGFHLGQVVLQQLGRAERKGAIDTFDVGGYRSMLERLRAGDETVYAPLYTREYEEPIAASIGVAPTVPVVLTEGNYLLAPGPEWDRVRALLDAVWYVETDDAVRLERLVARHVRFGKSPQDAQRWATGSDERNARFVREHRHRADLIVDAR